MPCLELQLTKQGWDLSQAQDCRSTVSGFYMPAPHPSFSSLNTLKCPNLGPLTHLFNSTFGGSIMVFLNYVLILPQFNSISLFPSMKPLYSLKKKKGSFHLLLPLGVGRFLVQISGSFVGNTGKDWHSVYKIYILDFQCSWYSQKRCIKSILFI